MQPLTAVLQAIAEYAAQQPGAAARGTGSRVPFDLSGAPLWLAALAALAGLWLMFGGRAGALQRVVGVALLAGAIYVGAPALGMAVPW